MKLAFIKKRFSIHGGAEKYLQTLVKYLKLSGFEIHIFASEWEKEEGIVFHKVRSLSFTSFLSTITFAANVKKEINKNTGAACVISFERTTCQDIYRAGEGCHAEWLNIRSKAESFCRRLSFRINPLHISILALEKKLFENTPLIIANSQMVKNQIMQHYAVQEHKIMIIYNGVDLTRFTPGDKLRWKDTVRRSLSIPADSPVVLFVGSGFERKGLETLIESVSFLRKPLLKVLVIGKGNVNKYREFAREKSISDNILFLDPQIEIEKYYAAADLFVLPTLYDPFSNATLEAMASGLPVITTKNNGVSELIENGQEGYILDSLFNGEELAGKISYALKSRDKMGTNARRKAEAVPIEKAAQTFTEAITRIINK